MYVGVMDLDEFKRRLADKGERTASCPTCGSTSWGGFAIVRLPIEPEGSGVGIQDSIRAVSATCGNCGFIRLYDSEIFGD